MTAVTAVLATVEARPPSVRGLGLILLARLACDEGLSRSDLVRDLGGAVQGGKPREAIDTELAALVRAALAVENRSRFSASAAAAEVLAGELGAKGLPKSWQDVRDTRLVAKALGLEREPAARIKGLLRPDRLRAEILVSTYGLKLRGAASATRLRSELALVALERAFGHRIKGGVSARNGFNAKTGRLLAGELLAKPRDVGTDSRLVAMLAAEAVGSTKPDPDALRLALLKRLAAGSAGKRGKVVVADEVAGPSIDAGEQVVPRAERMPAEVAAAIAVDVAGAPVQKLRHPAASRPGLDGFATAVQSAARDHAEGWPGSRKAFVSLVWAAIEQRHPDWGLSLIEFKAMLAEAHRTGHLALATADLRDRTQLKMLQDSAISYKNTVWHLIRIEE